MIVFGILAVVGMAHQIGWYRIAGTLANASLLFIICYLATSLLIALVLTLKWKLILHSQNINVPYTKLFTYRMVCYSVSYLTPTAHVGGEPIRAYLLQRENVPLNTAFSTVIIDKSIELMADVVFFFIGALIITGSVAVEGRMKLVLLVVSFLLIGLMAWFIHGILAKKSLFVAIFRFFRLNTIQRFMPIEKNIAKIEKEIERFYRYKKEYFIIIMILILVLWILMFFEYRFILLMLGHKASPLQIFLILTGVGLAYSIPIPAAMGVLELGQLSAAKVLRLSSATGIALAFIIRTRDLLWTAIGLFFLSTYHFDFFRLSKKTQQIDKEFEQGKLFKKRT